MTEELPLCECGCDELAKPGDRYIYQHHLRGKNHTSETLEKMSKTRKGVPKPPFTPEHCEAISKYQKENPEVYIERNGRQIGGNDIVNHHYIYDDSDLSKYTMKVTRKKHGQIHAWMRKAGIKVPHINVKEDN